MKKVLALAVVCFLVACSNPKDIVLGPEPLKTLESNGDSIRKLSEEDRKLLVGFMMAHEALKNLGGSKDLPTLTGLTVGEVLAKAQEWKKKQAEQAEEEKKRQQEVEALQKKVEAERKAIADRISSVITVAVVSKRVLPEDMDARRFEDQLVINYAVKNKGDKDIRLLKGKMEFFDAAGDKIGYLPLTFEERISEHKTVNTDTGSLWRVRSYGPADIKKIAYAQSDGMTTKFKPESIAFADGEVIKAPE